MIIPPEMMIVLLVVAGLLPVGLLLQVSNWAHSRFRNRLWHLRDDLVDDLLSGSIQFSPGSVRLLGIVETHIRNTKRHTFTDVLLAVALAKDLNLTSITEAVTEDTTPEADREALLAYFDRFRVANFHHLLASSPSGWIAWCLLTVRRIAARLLPDEVEQNPSIRKQVVRVELKAIPEMSPPPETPVRRGPLLEEAALMV